MLRLFDGDAIHVVDHLAHGIIAPAMRLAREGKVIIAEIERFGDRQIVNRQRLGQIGHDSFGCEGIDIAFAHHHPADILQHFGVVLVKASGAYIDNAGFPVRVLLEPDHLGFRPQRIAGPDRCQPASLRVAKVGHGVQRYIRHGFAEHDVKGNHIVQRAGRQAAALRELIGGIERMTCGIQRVVQRAFTILDGARHSMMQRLAYFIVLEETALVGLCLCHQCAPSLVSGV